MILEQELEQIVSDWLEKNVLHQGDLFVIGCSTSEVVGEKIGTAGSDEVAEQIFSAMQSLQQKTGVHLVFQCCEHLNRALVMERSTCEKYGYETVHVIPAKKAGGSMATFAYQQMNEPVVVEQIRARAGIDIGETMIGMHLKQVAVPIRLKQRKVGEARVNAAFTRPKLIGGARAIYQ